MSVVIPQDWPREAVVMPCACGGFVSASLAKPGPGLLAHYRELVHTESVWGQAVADQDVAVVEAHEARLERPTAGQPSVDVSGRPPRASAAPAGKPAA